MSDSQPQIEYQLNEEGLFSSFNERLQAIDSSLSWLMVKSLRRQGESVAGKKDNIAMTRSLISSAGFSNLDQQDTRIRSSSFSGRPSSRQSNSSSSSSSSIPHSSTFSSYDHLPISSDSLPPSSSSPALSSRSSSHSSLSSHSSHSSLPFSSEPCRYIHDETASSSSPSIRAREDLHYHRYHTSMHHYSYPSVPYENASEFYYPPPPLSSASFHSTLSSSSSYPTYHSQQIEDIQNNNIQQFLQQQQQQQFEEHEQQNQQIHLYGENGEIIDDTKWKDQVNFMEMNDDNKNEIEDKLNFQKDNLQQHNINELTVDDLVPGESKLEHKNNQDIEQTSDSTDAKENSENTENIENSEKLENQQNIDKKITNDELPKPKMARLSKTVSKWIHSEDSSDEDSNDDVVLPKDLPPPPTSLSPHQLTKPSPEKSYHSLVSDLTSRTPPIVYSKTNRHQRLKPSESVESNLLSTPTKQIIPSSSKSSPPTSKPPSQHLTRSLPIISSSSSSPSSSFPSSSFSPSRSSIPSSISTSSIPFYPSSSLPFSSTSSSDMRHMTRSLSNLDIREREAKREKERMRRKIYGGEDRRGEIERIDKLYRPGLGPTTARPPLSSSPTLSPALSSSLSSPSSRSIPSSRSHPSLSRSARASLDNSLREEVKYLSDNLDNFTNRERRSMSVESFDTRNTEERKRDTNEGALPLEDASLDGSFVIPLSYNEYISVLAKRYQDKASHIAKPSPVVSITNKKVPAKKKKASNGDLKKPADIRETIGRRVPSSDQ